MPLGGYRDGSEREVGAQILMDWMEWVGKGEIGKGKGETEGEGMRRKGRNVLLMKKIVPEPMQYHRLVK